MRKSGGNWFQRTTLSTPWVLAVSWVAVLAFGLLWLLFPILDGFSEIYYPGGGVDTFFWGLAAVLIAPVALGFHFVSFSAAFARNWSVRYLVLMLAPIGLLISLYLLLYPAGVTRADKRIDSFQLGARAAVKRAGGAAKVRQEALALLASSSETSLARSEWPDSFCQLHAERVTVDREAQRVDVYIPRRPCWGEQFGYLITEQDAKEPIIVDDPPLARGHRLWRVADGIYLYHTWP